MEKGTVVRHVFPVIALSALIGAVLMLWPVEKRTEAAQGSPALPAQAVTLYLPLVMKNFTPSIYGLVTLNGAPAAGITVTLQFSSTVSFSAIMTQTTSSDGMYQFVNAPSLAPGQRYLVQYVRPSGTTNTLRSWSTKSLTSYTQGENKAAGDFDIADVTLLQPPADVTITLPYTFTWNVRPASPTDTYKLQMNDPTTGQAWWTSLDLGYSGSYALDTLPPGISLGVLTTWSVLPIAPDGGNGRSSTRKATFQ
jgi:hypothetical protein